MEGGSPDFLSLDSQILQEFKNKESLRTSQIQTLLTAEWALVSLAAHLDDVFTMSSIIALQHLHEYHRESAILCIRRKPNVALALTRMACELSRDILIIARNEKAEKTWQNREFEKDLYRRLFRFSETSATEKGLRHLYKLTSQFGVHGHQTITALSGENIRIPDKEFMKIEVSQKFLGLAST